MTILVQEIIQINLMLQHGMLQEWIFLSEEQTLKYINRSNSMEVTKSPSTATTAELVDEAPSPSGSLPECEQIKRIHESNFDNPVFDSSEVVPSIDEYDDELTKSSNML